MRENSESYNSYLLRARRQLMLGSFRSYIDKIYPAAYMQKYIFGAHHDRIIQVLEKVVSGDIRKLIINIAPRYGKTELVVKMFISWCFAICSRSRFILLSYSSSLVEDNSEDIKDIMRSGYYRYMFPYVEISKKSDKKQKWNTTEGGGLYAVSTLGQVTGFGAGRTDSADEEERDLDEFTAWYNPGNFTGAVIIDDPIKPEDALSDNEREKVNRRFETTIRSRVNSRRTPIIIIGQRTHEHDLCGYVQEVEPGEWTVLSMPCLIFDEDGNETALWPHKHTVEELHKLQETDSFVFETQYQQNAKPLEGLMYERFKTYEVFPIGRYQIKNYTDTADTGSDFHCSIDYREYQNGECYVIDVLYTDKPMEYTEVKQAEMMTRDKVDLANIEGNNGGRTFSRNVEKNVRALGNAHTKFSTFTQSKNKDTRIFTNTATVQNMVYFPADWARRWPRFHNAMTSFRKEGRNAHDDAPDAVTGIVEMREKRQTTKFRRT